MIKKLLMKMQSSALISMKMRICILNYCGCSIHPTARIRPYCQLPNNLVMHAYSFINNGTFIDGSKLVVIEANVRIAINCTIITKSHTIGGPFRRSTKPDILDHVIIGEGSWIGCNVTILPGADIAPGCVIGACSLVTKPTELDGLYVGVPAKRVKDL